MKHKYDDKDIQAAIDAACEETFNTYKDITGSTLVIFPKSAGWADEKPSRLHLLKTALEMLPESPPPLVDGKTPGQWLHEASRDYDEKKNGCYGWKSWEQTNCQDLYEQAASAVLAAFGNKHPLATLAQNQVNLTPEQSAVVEQVLQSEVFGKSAEIPWTPWHGGPCPLKDEEVEEWEHKHVTCSIREVCKPSKISWKRNGTVSDIIAYRVTKWKEGFGPVDWKGIVEASIAQLNLDGTTPENLAMQIMQRDEIHIKTIARADKAEAELASLKEENAKMEAVITKWSQRQPQLSTLRPIAEAGAVPAGCVRYFFQITKGFAYSSGTLEQSSDDTHFADILLPVESTPQVIHDGGKVFPVAKPTAKTFTAHGKEWTKHVPGDPMPCERHRVIHVLYAQGDSTNYTPFDSSSFYWGEDTICIGWRYADEPTGKSTSEETITPEWTPSVGDVVTLKSGGPKMTVVNNDGTKVTCLWFNPLLERTFGDFLVKTLTKADS